MIENAKSDIDATKEEELLKMMDRLDDDEEMKEMLAMIENAKSDIDATKEEELLKMMDRLDDDEYFERLRNEAIAEEKAEKMEEERISRETADKDKNENISITKINTVVQEKSPEKLEEDVSTNKRRADQTVIDKEPSKKKTKEVLKKKKALAAGGVSIFGGKDLFGGKNPFASRKQESSSDESEPEELPDDNSSANKPLSTNGIVRIPPPPPPPAFLPLGNIAIAPDAEEKPVSFDDLPSNIHVISSTNKNRVTLPSKRRLPGKRIGKPAAMNGELISDSDTQIVNKKEELCDRHDETSVPDTNREINENTSELKERLAFPIGETDYDGDESEMSHSTLKRGRRSIKKKQPPRGGVALFGGTDVLRDKTMFSHRREESDEIDTNHSKECDPSGEKFLIQEEDMLGISKNDESIKMIKLNELEEENIRKPKEEEKSKHQEEKQKMKLLEEEQKHQLKLDEDRKRKDLA